MYRVIATFDDLKDGLHRYEVGDTYPRAGAKPSKERIEELSGTANRLKHPLIEKVVEPKPRKARK